jgi:monothiol glutaredoxin
MSIDGQTRGRIDALVREHRILLFMKGDRRFPQCGFSAIVVQILDALGCDYHTVDALADPQLREGIKEYSSWPTIPQLYVDGEFQGGCDIVREMYGSGELQQKLGPPQAGGRA